MKMNHFMNELFIVEMKFVENFDKNDSMQFEYKDLVEGFKCVELLNLSVPAKAGHRIAKAVIQMAPLLGLYYT